jgi:uncharacterized damage-inducible protein DinB
MSKIIELLREMEQESQTTRKMLSRVPDDHLDWQPHPKSMTVRRLATHIAELPTWVTMVLHTSELDFEDNSYQPKVVNNRGELMELFETSLADGRSHLADAEEAELDKQWTLRSGEQIYSVSSKAEVVRMAYCQIVHHRAQLGVFLRLLDIPIPGSYGPSADDPKM